MLIDEHHLAIQGPNPGPLNPFLPSATPSLPFESLTLATDVTLH